jgi:hypothetical protein
MNGESCAHDIWWTLDFASAFISPGVNSLAELVRRLGDNTISMGVRKEKIRGAERNLPDFFWLCPRCQKNFPEKLSKIVVDGGGGELITKNSY